MNIQNKFFYISVSFISVAVAAVSYLKHEDLKAKVNEVAISLCGETLYENISLQEKRNDICDFLAFTDIPDETKMHLAYIAEYNSEELQELCDEMLYFEYSDKSLKALCKKIEEVEIETDVFKSFNSITAEEFAEKLVREVFGRISVKTVYGDGENFIKRLYCSNFCIDACKDGVVRYMSDIKPENNTDRFSEWLSKNGSIVKTEMIVSDFEYKKIENEYFFAELYTDLNNGHVFAAQITIKS